MALIKCNNCNGKISDKASKCIHCGRSIETCIKHVCPECNKEYDNRLCKNCGYNNTKDTDRRNRNKNWSLVISIIISIVIVKMSQDFLIIRI